MNPLISVVKIGGARLRVGIRESRPPYTLNTVGSATAQSPGTACSYKKERNAHMERMHTKVDGCLRFGCACSSRSGLSSEFLFACAESTWSSARAAVARSRESLLLLLLSLLSAFCLPFLRSILSFLLLLLGVPVCRVWVCGTGAGAGEDVG